MKECIIEEQIMEVLAWMADNSITVSEQPNSERQRVQVEWDGKTIYLIGYRMDVAELSQWVALNLYTGANNEHLQAIASQIFLGENGHAELTLATPKGNK